VGHRIPYRLGEQIVAAHGADRVEAITIARVDADWKPVPGTERRIEVDAVCVGHGFTPRIELAVAAGCALDDRRFVVADEDRRTSVAGVYAAGEITGIGGAEAALVEGRIAGRAAAGAAPDAALRRRLRTATDFARRLEAAHGIRPGWREGLADQTIVCRCEEVTAGEVRSTAAATCQRSLRSVKLTSRAGLGICQGRMCGRSVEEILGADLAGGLADHRPIVTPVRLAELAAAAEPTPGGTP
jgi:NADPH-dependent 2,4-dienoyl-CoA reductase/sulfur reductase-like enzyme